MRDEEMIPLAVSGLGTLLCIVALFSPKLWIKLVCAGLIWAEVAYLSIFYPGTVARQVLVARPVEASNALFELGVQNLGERLFPSQLTVIYLAATIVLCFIPLRRGRN